MEKLTEQWKPVAGFETLYQVSNLGRVKSLDRFVTQEGNKGTRFTRKYAGKILVKTKDKHGYESVCIAYDNGKKITRNVHRLVAEAFIPNPKNYPQINHKDENPSNNAVSNLEWCDSKYNINYGSRNFITSLKRSKGVKQISKNGEIINRFINAKTAAKRTGIAYRNIAAVLHQTPHIKNGRIYTRKTAGGFYWEYII